MKQLFVAFFCVVALLSARDGARAAAFQPGTMTGRFMLTQQTPMSDGLVYIYNLANGPEPSRDRYWRVPDHFMKLDKDGRFTVQLLEGTYCVGAIKRNGPPQIGPPQEGDMFLLGTDGNGQPRKFTVKSNETVDLGVISGAKPFAPSLDTKGLTAIEGTILDAEGKPEAGVLVFAFPTPTVIGKPLFVSDRSARDGKFVLRVSEGGTYYLKLRSTFGGGPPQAGAILDGNKEQPLHRVTVKTGETIQGVSLTGKRFPGRGKDQGITVSNPPQGRP